MELLKFKGNMGSIGFADDLFGKRIHLVCPAAIGLSTCGAFVQMDGGLNSEEAEKGVSTVNQMNETGTFYPKMYMTVLPLSQFGERDDFGNIGLMKKHIEDAFEANEKYLKSAELIFDLQDMGGFDSDTALAALIEVSNLKSNLRFTKKVYFLN
ncbi:hypothetical protein [Rufibacter tibetensis]|uniref:Uncharacterized protein n=1 Tax=Rufibacter tibetensis TaxID=512763 RepID=A0A0P0C658_9BACT|nr:hypothetical protein [Rufibacter tibetensis]ALJ00687.1 hypothetical protein DC20_19025 [Rufibacter tibetensis]